MYFYFEMFPKRNGRSILNFAKTLKVGLIDIWLRNRVCRNKNKQMGFLKLPPCEYSSNIISGYHAVFHSKTETVYYIIEIFANEFQIQNLKCIQNTNLFDIKPVNVLSIDLILKYYFCTKLQMGLDTSLKI